MEKFIMFYRKENFLGHVWIYGKEELKKEVKGNELHGIEILQVIEVFDYREIDINNIV